MVDFNKRLSKMAREQLLDPVEIYETLDRESDKGPLRPAQIAILSAWHTTRRSERDTIVKLHTGQGKTLIGLLMLQSKLNEGLGPAVYLCPDKFLVSQTVAQAKQFGFKVATTASELPPDFLDSQAIFVTTVQKLFNGMTMFGLGPQSLPVGCLLMDDSHACVDKIRQCLCISIDGGEGPYTEIRELFRTSLEDQGLGTYADICRGDPSDFQLVPYWAWQEKLPEVVALLSNASSKEYMRYVWPLLRNDLGHCQCVISGEKLEIAPYLPPLHLFQSYSTASHRIFMSATVTNDSFLIKGLGLTAAIVENPLGYSDERWSGEKMILIPSCIDERLGRAAIVALIGKTSGMNWGRVVLTPSFARTRDWEAAGAVVSTRETIEQDIKRLIDGERTQTLVVANRYDGLDLPDSACRVLVLDSKPHSQSLIDLYSDGCRSSSDITTLRTARTIEQGLGRSVRGERDYCAIILIGPDLVKCIRTKEARKYLSNQTRRQIEIGLDIADMAREDLDDQYSPRKMVVSLINQCLSRDAGWKRYYTEQMDSMEPDQASGTVFRIFEKELDAERRFMAGDVDGAVRVMQDIVDNDAADGADKGWYLQEIARYLYPRSKSASNDMQVTAHRRNTFLLKPMRGMAVGKIPPVSQKRLESILDWVKSFESFQELRVALDDILSSLEFGVRADAFERALNDLSKALGFLGERPDKEWKEGPDNLWRLRDEEFILFECKSEVLRSRQCINEHETEQMNRSCAWFERYYQGSLVTNVIIIPTRKLANDAAFLKTVVVMDESGLRKLTYNARRFFSELSTYELGDISESKIQELVDLHKLGVEDLVPMYTASVRPRRN